MYSLGVIIIEMLTGKKMYPEDYDVRKIVILLLRTIPSFLSIFILIYKW
jgi:hypothetical protein